MNIYLIVVLSVIIGGYVLGLVADLLNIRHLATDVPAEFQGLYDEERYARSQNYLRENTLFDLLKDTLFLMVLLGFILTGGFNVLDVTIRSWGYPGLLNGLLFLGILAMAGLLFGLPFNVFHTFKIEKKYGFNRTTPRTFVLDLVKGLVLTAIIGGLVSAAVLWFFETTGPMAWLLVWGFVTAFQLIIMVISPVLIMPLFNKYEPLEPGELRTAIETYADRHHFHIQGVYKMDGSRRSTKTNAFFTGLGRFRRIVLFDTLIQKHSTEELLAIIAHEMGHYKKHHLYKGLGLSIVTSGAMFYCLSLFLNNPQLFAAFRMDHTSVYGSLIFFSFIFSPVDMLLGLFSGFLSRRHEYEADQYAADTIGSVDAMVMALKRLSVENLSNLSPHWLKVVLNYSHPPVLDRIRAIRKIR